MARGVIVINTSHRFLPGNTLSGVRAPALIIAGERDAFLSDSQEIHRLLKTSDFITIPDAERDIPEEHPETLSRAILTFLENVSQGIFTNVKSEDERVLRGIPASSGVARGKARIIPPDQIVPDLKPGEILVCKNAGPLWTPLFPMIGGLVMDQGVVGQHAAIIARECRIPAVIQTGRATEVIREGEMITVDGSQGMVYLP
ncbi:MAG: hypothetical protein HY731_14380 [Candidatus Tectomicrobia bacterium]|nr:hypothetical protein [Candidatus Tectomicrobia bacterium]